MRVRGLILIRVLGILFFVADLFCHSVHAATNPEAVDFRTQILPIISTKCFHCHGPDESSRKAKMRLDVRDEVVKEREAGVFVIKPNDLAHSELVQRITNPDPDEVMPPPDEKHPLTSQEIGLLKRWIQQGAPYEKHWAFVKPERPALPKIKTKRWPRNAIDYFVLAKIEAANLKPSPPAGRSVLLRRVSLDLTGLPPTPEEMKIFLNDKSKNAYEKVVDRLLASSAYGERWARMWLDIARYADSAGYGSDPLRLGIWPYRDWVINAFNRNLPFDEFTLEQIAGDLLENATDEQKIASAFHRNTMTNTEGGTDDEEWRVAAVKDRANVTAQAWMGLTMGCAQCHTHKFDPITQKEYYQFYAFFNQTEDNDQPDEQPTLPIGEGDVEKVKSLEKEIAALEEMGKTNAAVKKKIAPLKKNLAKAKPVAVPVMRELASDKHRVTHLLFKGSYLSPADEVSPGIPAAFNPWPAEAPTNRLGVAEWLMSPENPLTARVTANRFWSQIFGTGIVETEEDFGTQGTLPSHPELLDWLAVELRDGGWNVKQFLKTIVMSATYRQSSRLTPELLQKDPRNILLARAPRRRLDAETVRDQALALSELLSRKLGGPSVYPPQPDGLWRAAFNGERTYDTSTGEDRHRRGLYTIWRRTVPYPSMATFDAPSRESCTFRRLPTNTPLQAYVTLNDPVYVEAAQALGRRLVNEGGTTLEKRIRFGLQLVLSRAPTKLEIAALMELYQSELARYETDEKSAKQLAAQKDETLPENLSAAEAAAWMVIGNVLLNLDGVLMKG